MKLVRKVRQVLVMTVAVHALTATAHDSQRIVSLGPAITKELYLLGAEDKLVGCTIYCQNPPEAKLKERIGTVIDVDVEKIVSLKPDLVLATPLTDPKAIKKLKKLKIDVKEFPATINFSQICQQFLELGKIVGEEKKAESIVKNAKDKMRLMNESTKGLPRPRIFIQTGAKPLNTPNRGSFIHDCIVHAGGINVAAGSENESGYDFYSREHIVKQNPDVIIIVTMGIMGEKEKETWEKYKTIEAVRNKKVYIVDSDKFCSPTPISFVEAVEELVNIIHSKSL